MPHIHNLIDFVVSAFIVHGSKILLVHHKILDAWLPVGGHIELNEDSDEALYREIEEETGLKASEIEIIGTKLKYNIEGTKFLHAPLFVDIHNFRALPNHRHLGLVYLVKSKTDQVRLCGKEHNEIRWFSLSDLHDPKFALWDSIGLYARMCLLQIDHIRLKLIQLGLIA